MSSKQDEGPGTLPGAPADLPTAPTVARIGDTVPIPPGAAAPLGTGAGPAPVDPGGATLSDSSYAERYRPRSVLGQGGMGEVILCHDGRIGRDVAVKVVRAGQGSRSDLRQRFVREARIQGQLEHPSVVPVYDLGINPAGEAYFTMKRIRGVSLEEVLCGLRSGDPELQRRHPQRRLLSAFLSVCLAVDFAHRRGVIHRDLKPANIMLGSYGEVYVLDWGLAKLAGAPEDGLDPSGAIQAPLVAAAQTVAGQVLGTPGYMAPEQVRGDLLALDARTDVYALGAILFEILTQKPLHDKPTYEALLVSTLAGAEARPSVRAPAREVPPELEALCVRATALDPAARFPGARELHDALERYLDGDRDLALRQELARRHAERAEQAAARAIDDTGEAAEAERVQALQEAGSALALDPRNASALGTFFRLMTAPPRTVPAEAQVEIDRAEGESIRQALRSGGVAYLAWLPLIPIYFWLGVRDWLGFGVQWFFILLAGVMSVAISRLPRVRPWHAYPAMVTGLLAIGFGTRMFGPLILMPGLALMCSLAYTIQPNHRLRVVTTFLSILIIVGPAALEGAGLLPRSYAFTPWGMLVRPQMVGLPAAPTLAFLVLTSVGMVLTAGLFVGRVRDQLSAAERRLHLQAWQLRQLVPRQDGRGM